MSLESPPREITKEDASILFCWVLEDLDARTQVVRNGHPNPAYQTLNIARLLRILFIDGAPLYAICNRFYRLKLQVPDWTIHENCLDGSSKPDSIYALLENERPKDQSGRLLLPCYRAIKYYLSREMDGLIMLGQRYTPHEIILFYANNMGGVHISGVLKPQEDEKFFRVESGVKLGGRSPLSLALTSRVAPRLVDCLKPLYELASATRELAYESSEKRESAFSFMIGDQTVFRP